MEKTITAIGNFYNEEGFEPIAVPDSEEEILTAIDAIIAKYPMGSVIADDDVAILRAYLPAIGADELSQDENGSLQGKAHTQKTVEGLGLEIEVEGAVEVKSRWEQHHDRKEWSGDLRMKRIGGDAKAKELKFRFTYFSIGQDVEGNFIVLFSAQHERSFNDPVHMADFHEGGVAEGSRYDISKHIQWGFFARAVCEVLTFQGTMTV